MALAPALALGAGSKPIEKARQLIEDAEFEQAVKVLNDALQSPDNSDAMLVSLYELQGTAYLFLNKEDKARAAFERLLQAEPDHQLPKATSAKIRTLFEEVRAERRPVKLEHTRLTSAKAGERLDVRAQITNLPQGAKPRLYYRRAGSEAYSSTSFTAEAGSDYAAKVPAFELPVEDSEYALEYYLEVGDASGRRVAGVGDALSPMRIRVSAATEPTPVGETPATVESESWYQKWWVWTIVGVVVVGAGVTAGVVLTQPTDAKVPVTVKVQQ